MGGSRSAAGIPFPDPGAGGGGCAWARPAQRAAGSRGGLVGWVMPRIIRGGYLGARQMEYVTAARAAGASNLRIILHHIAPNILGPIIVIASLDVGWIIWESPASTSWGWARSRPRRNGAPCSTTPGRTCNHAPACCCSRGWPYSSRSWGSTCWGTAPGSARSPHRAAGRLTGRGPDPAESGLISRDRTFSGSRIPHRKTRRHSALNQRKAPASRSKISSIVVAVKMFTGTPSANTLPFLIASLRSA